VEGGGPGKAFRDLPLSRITLQGLDRNKFSAMTDIQLAAVPHALAGRDVLGAAKTGSGKTLAFVVPLLEKLYREGWALSDGLGALIITPTRELALQIFEVLRTVGKGHMFSAALLTGGKKEFREEQARVPRMNIIVATPGRLLQHLEETPGFDASQLQVLVLDEADRILDMGFSRQLNAILAYLPPGAGRQTLLFSATQTKSVKDLARLSLDKNSEYVGVHDTAAHATPDRLVQNYLVAALADKMDTLWAFIKSHMKHKLVVFFSSCSQVRYVHACFRALQPGVPLLALHGKIKQARRTHIYFEFVRRPAAVLFATDIAARGLDFPACDWVVQVDAPEDTAMYIHRVGRTARYRSGGRSLLFLLPSEEGGMLRRLEAAHVPISRVTVNPSKTTSVRQKTAAVVASNPECKRLAQKAFVSYLRSVALMPLKDVFDISALDVEAFADALGLSKCPSTKFLKALKEGEGGAEEGREAVREKKNRCRALERLKEKIKMERAEKARERRREEAGEGVGSEGEQGAGGRREGGKDGSEEEGEEAEEVGDEDGSENDEDEGGGGLLLVKRKHSWDMEDAEEAESLLEKAKRKKAKKEKMKIAVERTRSQNKKIVFAEESDEEVVEEGKGAKGMKQLDGEPKSERRDRLTMEAENEGLVSDMMTLKAQNEAYVQAVQRRLLVSREEDRAKERERVREKHKKRRLREKGEREEEQEEAQLGNGVALGSFEEEEESGEQDEDEGEVDEEEEEGEEEEVNNDNVVNEGRQDRLVEGMSLREQEEAVLRSLRGG